MVLKMPEQPLMTFNFVFFERENMKQTILAMRFAGVTLSDFRKLSKADRVLLWIMVVMTCQRGKR